MYNGIHALNAQHSSSNHEESSSQETIVLFFPELFQLFSQRMVKKCNSDLIGL